MSWLKKIGSIAAQVGLFAIGVQKILPPSVTGIVHTIEEVLSRVLQVIVDVEAMGGALGLSGAQKLDAAVSASIDIFLRWSAALGHTIAADKVDLFTQGVRKVVDGLVDIANSWKGDVDTQKTVG